MQLMEESAGRCRESKSQYSRRVHPTNTVAGKNSWITALFFPVTTAADGTAQITAQLPDNITGWRVTAVAVTPDLKAGDTTDQVIATLPFYLRPLYTTPIWKRTM